MVRMLRHGMCDPLTARVAEEEEEEEEEEEMNLLVWLSCRP